jgi:hypothetical protein
VEGAAKIVLADWQGVGSHSSSRRWRDRQGKAATARDGARKNGEEAAVDEDEEWKGVAIDEDVEGKRVRVPGVKQNLGSILRKNTFVPEDVRKLEAGGDSEEEVDDEDFEKEEAEDGEGDEEEELGWGDVFAGDNIGVSKVVEEVQVTGLWLYVICCGCIIGFDEDSAKSSDDSAEDDESTSGVILTRMPMLTKRREEEDPMLITEEEYMKTHKVRCHSLSWLRFFLTDEPCIFRRKTIHFYSNANRCTYKNNGRPTHR